MLRTLSALLLAVSCGGSEVVETSVVDVLRFDVDCPVEVTLSVDGVPVTMEMDAEAIVDDGETLYCSAVSVMVADSRTVWLDMSTSDPGCETALARRTVDLRVIGREVVE